MDKKTVITIVLCVLILVGILYFVGIDQVIEALKHADLGIIILAIVAQIFTYFLYALRWKLLNSIADMDVSIKKLIPMVLVGLAVNNITPSGRGGGEPVRAYILAKEENYQMEDTFATVVADRALDTFPFIVLAVITIIAMILYFDIALWLILVMILAVIGIVAVLAILIYMSINPNFGSRVEGWILKLVKRFYKKNSEGLEEKIHSIIFGFQNTMKLLISNKKLLYLAIPLSFLIWIFEIIRVYLVFLAFGANVNLIVIGEVFIVASLVGMIPLLPGGIGAVDTLMIFFYSSAGITASISAAATVIERLISFWMATMIGLLILPYYGTSIWDKLSFSKSSDELGESLEEDLDEK